MFGKRLRKGIIIAAVCVAAFSPALRAHTQNVAEAARKAKAKKQQQQSDRSTASTPAKSKTLTNDDFPDSGGSAVAGPKNTASVQVIAPGKDTAWVTLILANYAIKRPGSAEVIWRVKNTSDHLLDITVTLIVDGPCGFHDQHALPFRLKGGAGAGDSKSLGEEFYAGNCPGKYTFELRAASGGKVLSTAGTSLVVQ
jgi:hypothetical protein